MFLVTMSSRWIAISLMVLVAILVFDSFLVRALDGQSLVPVMWVALLPWVIRLSIVFRSSLSRSMFHKRTKYFFITFVFFFVCWSIFAARSLETKSDDKLDSLSYLLQQCVTIAWCVLMILSIVYSFVLSISIKNYVSAMVVWIAAVIIGITAVFAEQLFRQVRGEQNVVYFSSSAFWLTLIAVTSPGWVWVRGTDRATAPSR